MKLSSYWFANFVYDYILYAVVAVVSALVCLALDVGSLTDGDAYGATWMLFMFYGTAYIWLTYVFAFLFKDYGAAQAGYFFLTFVVGGLIPILILVLRALNENTRRFGKGIAWILRIHPSFAFG